MKFDSVIIGGGLAGLTAGISLAAKGHNTAIIATGHSALHFNPGSFGLLDSNIDINSLAPGHPYSKIGAQNITALTDHAHALLSDTGLNFLKDHSNITPMGIVQTSWLTLDGMLTIESLAATGAKDLTIVGIDGFLDFYPRFIASALQKQGYNCIVSSITTDTLGRLRSNPSEMRAANISRIITAADLDTLARQINAQASNADAIIFPAIIGLNGYDQFKQLRDKVSKPLFYAPTVGISVTGMMIASMLKGRFTSLGGHMLKGQSVISGTFANNRLSSVTTDKLDDTIKADNFILAAGSFFSHGLKALPDRIVEPALGLDTETPDGPLCHKDLLSPQPFMKAGLASDPSFRCLRARSAVENLYGAGAILSSADSLSENSGAGIAMLTALHIANKL